jgi:hypothetical protein
MHRLGPGPPGGLARIDMAQRVAARACPVLLGLPAHFPTQRDPVPLTNDFGLKRQSDNRSSIPKSIPTWCLLPRLASARLSLTQFEALFWITRSRPVHLAENCLRHEDAQRDCE